MDRVISSLTASRLESGGVIALAGKLNNPNTDIAYMIQDAVTTAVCLGLKTDAVGYKISMTSPRAQNLVGAAEPAYGPILRTQVYASGSELFLSTYNEPRLEAELVFIVREPIGAKAGISEILSKCDVVAGLEIPDSRFESWHGQVTLFELIADGALGGGLVVGSDPVPATTVDVANTTVNLLVGGKVVLAAAAREVMGDPANAVQWLARKLDERGRSLQAGEIVSSGSFGPSLEFGKGQYEVVFTGVGEAAVRVI